MAETKKILVVDDEVDCVEFVTAVLEDMDDYQIFTASNGEEAVAIVQAEKPDLVIMDVMMPKKDGYTAFSEIKQDPATAETPVVMLSSLTELGEYVRYNPLPVRPQLFLDKPIEPEKLAKIIERVLASS